MFKAEKFDANAWAELFRKAGAKYVVPVAEHHDGFAMYDSRLHRLDRRENGPEARHRRRTGQGRRAARAALRRSSPPRRALVLFNGGGSSSTPTFATRAYAAFYGPAQPKRSTRTAQLEGHPDAAYLNDWLARTAEIVDKYQPEIVWFDWWIERPEFEPYLQRLAAFYYNRAARVGAPRRGDQLQERGLSPKAAVLDIERGQPDRSCPSSGRRILR